MSNKKEGLEKSNDSKSTESRIGNTKTDYLGVTAVIAIMEPASKSQEVSRKKLLLVSCPSNKVRVLLDSG